MSLIPTKLQWQSWSLPSKLTAIGTLVTILAFSAYVMEKTYGIYGFTHAEQTEQIQLPEFGLLFLNKGKEKVTVHSTGEYQVLADLTPMMDTVVQNGRFIIGSKEGNKPHAEYFEVLPSKNISLEGSFINSKKLRLYFDAGDYSIRLFFKVNDRIVQKIIPFNQEHLLGELIAVYLEVT